VTKCKALTGCISLPIKLFSMPKLYRAYTSLFNTTGRKTISIALPQTVLVLIDRRSIDIQPFQTVAKDIIIRSLRPKRSVNPPLTAL